MKQNITFRITEEKREKIESLRQKKLQEHGLELTLSGIINYLIDRAFQVEESEWARNDVE